MLKLIGLLSGSGGILWAVGITLVLLAAGGVGGYSARGIVDAPIISNQKTLTAEANTRTQTCVAAHEKSRADGAEISITALQNSANNVAASLDYLASQAVKRGKSFNDFVKELSNVPISKVCGSSDPERAYRRNALGLSGVGPTSTSH